MRVPKEDWDFLNEKAFEDALQASVPERLPDKVAVTPWKRAMGRVLAGTALTALGTNLWGLNYLLPGIGLVLMLLGFRLLRREEIDACRGAYRRWSAFRSSTRREASAEAAAPTRYA